MPDQPVKGVVVKQPNHVNHHTHEGVYVHRLHAVGQQQDLASPGKREVGAAAERLAIWLWSGSGA